MRAPSRHKATPRHPTPHMPPHTPHPAHLHAVDARLAALDGVALDARNPIAVAVKCELGATCMGIVHKHRKGMGEQATPKLDIVYEHRKGKEEQGTPKLPLNRTNESRAERTQQSSYNFLSSGPKSMIMLACMVTHPCMVCVCAQNATLTCVLCSCAGVHACCPMPLCMLPHATVHAAPRQHAAAPRHCAC